MSRAAASMGLERSCVQRVGVRWAGVMARSESKTMARALPGMVVAVAVAAAPFVLAGSCATGRAPGALAPISLVAGDGQELALVALEARAVLVGPLAFTELHVTFRNPEQRVREGRFRMVMPPGAAVSRLAMRVAGVWQEGEMVPSRRAREIYSTFLRRRQDPALLEAAGGTEYGARIFPIGPREDKQIIVSYSHELRRSDEPYVLALAGLPRIPGGWKVRVFGAGKAAAALAAAEGTGAPPRDIVVPQPVAPGGPGSSPAPSAVLRAGELAVARVRVPEAPAAAIAPPGRQGAAAAGAAVAAGATSYVLLVDTSASRALGFEAQLRLVAGLVAVAGRDDGARLKVLAFDQETELVFDGPARDFGVRNLLSLRARGALGASDLEGALRAATAAAATLPPGPRRLVIVSDGVDTASTLSGPASGSAPPGTAAVFDRADALVVGGLRDEDRLNRLVDRVPARPGLLLDGGRPLPELQDRLGRAVPVMPALKVPGASWSWPRELRGVQEGDEVLVFAVVPRDAPFSVAVGERELPLGARAEAPLPLLERAVARARIADLVAAWQAIAPEHAALRAPLEQQAVELSLARRVLSPFTALLVLEDDAAYDRFGLDRTALGDILAIDPRMGTLDVIRRQPLGAERRGALSWTDIAAVPRSGGDDDGNGDGDGDDDDDDDDPDREVGARNILQGGVIEDRERGGRTANRSAHELSISKAESSRTIANVPGRAPAIRPDIAPEPPAVTGPWESRRAGERPRAASRRAAGEPARSPAKEPQARRHAAGAAPRFPPHDGRRAPAPLAGDYREVRELLGRGARAQALAVAQRWRAREPGEILAYVALGEAWEAAGDARRAARAYGSLLDLFPARADVRRFAAGLLERAGTAEGRALGGDALARAAALQPELALGARAHAFALLRAGKPEQAFAAVAAAMPFAGEGGIAADADEAGDGGALRELLLQDLGLIGAAWRATEPARAADIDAQLAEAGARFEDEPSLRVVLTWEAAATDMDLHVRDAGGWHAFYGRHDLPSGGLFHGDRRGGWGPEWLTIREPPARRAYPYKLEVRYHQRGPMGYSFGRVAIVEHDGRGHLGFDERPFVVMNEGAYVDLGAIEGPLLR
jgi:hypothetical protein